MAADTPYTIVLDTRKMTYGEFIAKYPTRPGSVDHETLQLILNASLTNQDIPSRIALAELFLEWGADPTEVSRQQGNILHSFATHVKDPAAEAPLLKRLLDMGADPNQHAPHYGWPLEIFLTKPKLNEQLLKPVYDVWFTHPHLDFLTRLPDGESQWDKVWRSSPMNPGLMERIKRYITEHTGSPPPTPQYRKRQPDKTWLRFDHGQQIEQGPDGFWHVVTQ